MGDYDDDGILDIYAINKQGGSGRTNVHILGGSGSFMTFLLHQATALHQTGVDNAFAFVLRRFGD